MTWIAVDVGGPETTVSTSTRHGLHGSRLCAAGSAARFVFPAGALD